MQADEIAILDLAFSELEFFRSLKKLASQSIELINSEDMEGLIYVLEDKDKAISRYDIILEEWNKIGLSLGIKDGRGNPDFLTLITKALPDETGGTDSFSAKLKSLFEQIKLLVDELVNMEDNAQEVLSDYVKRLRTRISQVSNGRKACKGYASASGSSLSSVYSR